MHARFGILTVTVPYCYQRGKSLYFQRAIPQDLQDKCGAKRVKIKLQATELHRAAREIDKLNRKVEAEWLTLRGDPSAVAGTGRDKARRLLGDFGLSPAPSENHPVAVELFSDFIDSKREQWAEGDEDAYRNAEDYLDPVEAEAARLLLGTSLPCLSDALELYLGTHKKRDDATFAEYARGVMQSLIEAVGDKPIAEFTRADGHKFVSAQLANGMTTGTIRRRLNSARAMLASWILEKNLDRANPLASIQVPDEGKDAKRRRPFRQADLEVLATACREADDDIRWLIALLAGSGARLAEIAGLAQSDIKLNAQVPHIVIQPHPWRSLKTPTSAREVPLVGLALWSAERVVASKSGGQTRAFPRYAEPKGTKATHASGAIAKWIRKLGIDRTAHELRHTMADLLREAGCPEDVRLAIGGWASVGEGAKYGQGYSLRIKREWLEKATVPSVEGTVPR